MKMFKERVITNRKNGSGGINKTMGTLGQDCVKNQEVDGKFDGQ